ncbi:MAG: type II toxin-antitoxin system prevent-host-death family antitoxin [Pseudomonadota bacterium]
MPEALTYSEARKNLAATMEKVCDSHDHVIITRRQARPVVMMSLEAYNSIEESAYLLRSPNNAQRLRESIAEMRQGQHCQHALFEE